MPEKWFIILIGIFVTSWIIAEICSAILNLNEGITVVLFYALCVIGAYLETVYFDKL